jgi:hypothetical protein
MLALAAAPSGAQAPGDKSAYNPQACKRACLEGAVNGYMAALRAKDPKKAPLAPGVIFTENNVVMPVGEGLWNSISEASADGTLAADPVSGQAAWFGLIREHGVPAYYAMLIKADGAGRITQVETVVHRKTSLPSPFGDVDKYGHDAEFEKPLAPEQRRSRERMKSIADSYFSTVERNDGTVFAPFTTDCERNENGLSTTSGQGGSAAVANGCENQFKLGIYNINKEIRERRYPLIDEERGVVVATAFFDHANFYDTYKLTDGREMKTLLKWPNSITLIEGFKIQNGKIHRIEVVFTYVPYFMHNPWARPAPGGVDR